MMDSRFGDVLKAQETKPRTASCEAGVSVAGHKVSDESI